MATKSSSALRAALAHGRSYLGYREAPPRSNRTRFGKQFGWDGVAWCVIYTWCILQDTGSSAATVKTASTGALEAWGKSVGRFSRTPHTGDLIILRNSRGATIHTEFVYSWDGHRLIGLGGNTSGGAGSVADGGTVALNDRTNLYRAGRITFVRPFYGVTVEDVRAIQTAAGIKVDGIIGPATVAAIKALQARHGLTVDGFPGPVTMGAITGQRVEQAATKPVAAATVERMRTDGILDVAAAGIIQGRLGTPRDGRIGPTDVTALQRFLGMRVVDGRLDGQNTYGRGKTPGIHPDVFRLGRGGSATVRALQAYTGLTGRDIDGLWGDQLNRQLAAMLGFPAFLTPADAGIADQRLRAAGLR